MALLTKRSVRLVGLAAVVCAAFAWAQSTRPALLVADDGGLIGLQTDAGRALSKARGSGFVAGIWLENDGAPVAQDLAVARAGLTVLGRQAAADLAGWRVLQLSGKTELAALEGCNGADIVISNQVDEVARPCVVFDVTRLRNKGALAFDVSANGGLVIETAHHVAGARPWNARQGPRGDPLILTTEARKRGAEAPRMSQVLQPQ